jgi:Tol biopolymer transport system component
MPRIYLFISLLVILIIAAPTVWGAPDYKLAYESEAGEDQFNIYQTDITGNQPLLMFENAEHPSLTSEGILYFTRFEETVWGDFWKAYSYSGNKLASVTINTVFTEREPTVSRNGLYVVFQSDRAGTSEIIYEPLSPTEPTVRITQNNTNDIEPTIDGEGKNIYYVVLASMNESYIYKALSNGGGQERLSKPGQRDRHPSVDAANRLLAFSSERDGNSEIYVMDLTNRNVKRLTNDAAWDGNPSISSDGKWIAFTSERDGNKEIYVIQSDGNGLHRITTNEIIDDHPALS